MHASCGSAFCAVNTNWNLHGLAAEPGWRLDLRYEYINQDQPMAGSDKVVVGQVPRDHDELKTINRNYLGTLDYTINEQWGVSATAPVSDRFHTHIQSDSGAPEQWDFTRLGDARVLGRYQLRSENQEKLSLGFYGFNFGLKLPTGDRDLRNADGERAERTLQPGTGTTDLLLGAYYNQVLPNSGSSWFVQGLAAITAEQQGGLPARAARVVRRGLSLRGDGENRAHDPAECAAPGQETAGCRPSRRTAAASSCF